MLRDQIERYLALRRASGFDFRDGERMLGSFVRFAEARGDRHIVVGTVTAWAAQAPSQSTRKGRMTAVRSFARFLKAEDPRHQVPHPSPADKYVKRQVPYIFSEEEVRLLVHHASRLGPRGSLRPHTLSTLFGLLAVTGMRLGEALSLQLDDFETDRLRIRRTKFHKSRLVPLHDSTVTSLTRYVARRKRIVGAGSHLFLSLRRTPLSRTSAHVAFHKICEAARIPRQTGAWSPRIHDLRHAFAVRSLEESPDDREHVTQHTLALTTYMGHARVASTYWYLQATPALMEDIANQCAKVGVRGEP